jgi:AcrR family transcriptional regulator
MAAKKRNQSASSGRTAVGAAEALPVNGADDAPRALAGTLLTPKGQQTQARISQAGREVLEDRGYFEATVVEITERSGIALGTYYRYFENKEVLFLHLLEALLADLNRSTQADWDGGDIQDNIRKLTLGYLAAYYENRRLIAGLLEMAAAVPVCAARWWELRTQVYERMERYIAGSPLAEVADPTLSAVALGGMTEQLAYYWFVEGVKHDHELPSIDAVADNVATLWFRSVYQH